MPRSREPIAALSITLDLKPSAAAAKAPDAPVNLAGLGRAALQGALVASGLIAPDKARMRVRNLPKALNPGLP